MKMKTKRTLKRIGLFLAVAILGGLTASFAMTAVNGFDKDLNPDNLIKVEEYVLKDGDTNGKGIDVTVNDEGVVKLNGTASSDDEYIVTTLSLKAGTYTISGLKSQVDGVSLKAVYNGTKSAVAGLTDATFTLEAETTVDIVISVKEDTFCLNKTVKPVLVLGEDAGEFYAK